MNEENRKTLLEAITILRLPLMILVVLIHAYPCLESRVGEAFYNAEIFSCFAYFISQIVSRIAVPLFFVISGFLYFFNIEQKMTWNVYLSKTQKRVRTLLIPYLIWNIVALFIYGSAHVLGINMGADVSMESWGIREWLVCFLDTSYIKGNNSHFPINYPLWFMRDLILLVLVSPLIYCAIKYVRWLFIVVLGTLWFIGLELFYIAGVSTLLFFSIGAWLAIEQIDVVALCRKKMFIPLYMCCALIELVIHSTEILGGEKILHKIIILLGIVAFVSMAIWLLDSHQIKVNNLWSGSAMFIYVYHAIPLSVITKMMLLLLRGYINNLTLCLVYIMSVVLIVLIGVFVYKYMSKFLPRFTAFVLGGR